MAKKIAARRSKPKKQAGRLYICSELTVAQLETEFEAARQVGAAKITVVRGSSGELTIKQDYIRDCPDEEELFSIDTGSQSNLFEQIDNLPERFKFLS